VTAALSQRSTSPEFAEPALLRSSSSDSASRTAWRDGRDGDTVSRKRLAAEKAHAEGEKLQAQPDADSNRRAIKKYQEAIDLWKAIGEGRMEAKSLRALGEIHARLGEPQKALEHFGRAMQLCQSLRDSACEVATRNELSAAYLTVGEIDKSWENCTAALELSRAASDHTGEAQALNNIGEVYYFRGDREKALAQYGQALPIWKSLGDLRGQAQTFLYLGYSHSDLSNAESAFASYEQALALWRAADDVRGQALTLTAIGHLHNNLGARQQALDNYGRAIPLFRSLGDRLGEARALNGMGYMYQELGESQRAIDYYKQARRLFQSVSYKSGEAANLELTGKVYYSLGDHRAAFEYFQESLTMLRALADERLESYLLTDIGMVYTAQGDWKKAGDYCDQALVINRKLKDRNRESYTLSSIAHLHEQLGERQKAVALYEQALALNRETGDHPEEAITLYNIARVQRDLGDLEGARALVEQSLSVSDALRTKISGNEMRASYFATVHQRYEFYTNVLMQLHQKRPDAGFDVAAFEAGERGRARSLLDSLAEAHASIKQGVDPELLRRDRELQRRINAEGERRIQLAGAKVSAEELAAVEKDIGELTMEYQQVQGQIRSSSPRYAALTQPVPLTLKEIQQKVLDADTLLLEYALGDERSFVWAVTPDSIKSFELPARSKVEKTARRVYELLTERNRQIKDETDEQKKSRIASAESQYAEASRELSAMLLSSVAGELQGKRLVVVADGALQYVPFAALPISSQESGTEGRPTNAATGNGSPTSQGTSPPRPDDGFTPLMVEHEVISLPSASVLALVREELRGRRPAPKSVAVLADSIFDANDERLVAAKAARARRRDGTEARARRTDPAGGTPNVAQLALRDFDGLGEGIARLPFSLREAEAIMAAVPTKDGMMAVGFRASRATATSPELSNYRIVHFAAHGLLNSEHPELSGIVFSLFDETGKRQDGFLQLSEIYNLNLPADLVVLSACQTALGKEVKGEGLVGLTRGFMYAGAPRVVASLWKVDDAATANLMGEFYKVMLGKEGMTPAAALRAAQVHMWRQNRWRSPYYWAAFTLQGEWK
jgi:CHAT domain-containing protein/Tfp pilus assembly protein PilF